MTPHNCEEERGGETSLNIHEQKQNYKQDVVGEFVTGHVAAYKSWAVVAEGGFHVSGLLEVVDEAKAQFGADDTGPHEVGCDLISADEALPGQPQRTHSIIE